MTDLERDFRQALMRLRLISHAPAGAYDREHNGSTDEDIGGKRPPGSDHDKPRHPGQNASDKRIAEYHEDYAAWMSSYQRKTCDYFIEQHARCHTDHSLKALIVEIEKTIEAWKRQPIPPGQPPEYGSPQWKRWIAESNKDAGDLARMFGLTRQRIYQIRREYRMAA